MNTDEVLEQVEALDALATPGPWRWEDPGPADMAEARLVGEGREVCNFGDASPYDQTSGSPPSDVDRTLIALARVALPALVAEIRRLRAELATTDAALQACRALEDGPVVLRIPAGAKLPPGLQTGMVLLDSDEQEEPAPGGTPEGWEGPEEWEDPEERVGEERLQKYADAMAAIHARYPEQEDGAVEPAPASYANQPIGTCERCSTPVYITGGFCGVCNPGLL